MIYLDRFGHLFSDESVDELYEFGVNRLGLKPEWNHYSRNLPHFDLTTKRKQNEAVKLGAVWLEDSREIVDMYQKCRFVYPSSSDKCLPYVKGTGLHGQALLRVDFKKYFEAKPKACDMITCDCHKRIE